MKTILTREALTEAIKPINAIRPSTRDVRADMCGAIEFCAIDKVLLATGSDSDIEIETTTTDCQVHADGITHIPVKEALDFLGTLPKGALVTIEKDKISSRGVEHTFEIDPDGVFASKTDIQDKFESGIRYEFDTEYLLDKFTKLGVSISEEDTRYYLNGIYFTDKARHMVSTDGHRMTMSKFKPLSRSSVKPTGKDSQGNKREIAIGMILPRGVISLIAPMMKKAGGKTMLAWENCRALIHFGNVRIRTKLIDGSFPDYTRVDPSMSGDKAVTPTHIVRCDRERLVDVIQMAYGKKFPPKGAPGNGRDTACQLEIANGSPTLFVAFNKQNNVKGIGKLPCTLVNAAKKGPLVHGFSEAYQSGYITVFARNISGDFILHMFDKGTPAIVLDSADTDTKRILMPMRHGEEPGVLSTGKQWQDPANADEDAKSGKVAASA